MLCIRGGNPDPGRPTTGTEGDQIGTFDSMPVQRRCLGRAERLATTARLARQSNELARHVEVRARPDMIEMGTRGYGFWSVPEILLGPESVCYLVGTGEDISFDLALIDRFGCTVHAFDPVPSAQEFVRTRRDMNRGLSSTLRRLVRGHDDSLPCASSLRARLPLGDEHPPTRGRLRGGCPLDRIGDA